MAKNWEDMSNKEKALQTIRDIKRRQEAREAAKLEKRENNTLNFDYDNIDRYREEWEYYK